MKLDTGSRFGRLVVVSDQGPGAVECSCSCGKSIVVVRSNLRAGRTQSCGCLRSEANTLRAVPMAERFWDKVQRGPEADDCWPWLGSLDAKGYGRFHDGTRGRKAHAVAFELSYGAIPEGTEPDHRCHDAGLCQLGDSCPHRRCCNPLHLEAVSHRENCQRAAYAKDECANGHRLPAPGTDGRRVCRECANRRSRQYKANRKAVYDAVMGR